jgi:hypothetical protein
VSHRRGPIGFLLITALLTSVLAAPAVVGDESLADGWSRGSPAPTEPGHWVTLLTGDRVYLAGDGIRRAVGYRKRPSPWPHRTPGRGPHVALSW